MNLLTENEIKIRAIYAYIMSEGLKKKKLSLYQKNVDQHVFLSISDIWIIYITVFFNLSMKFYAFQGTKKIFFSLWILLKLKELKFN